MGIEILYKYGRLTEHSKALFTTPTVWFSAPAQLNDPFECRPWLTFEGTQDQIVASLTRKLKRRHPELPLEDAQAEAVSMFRRKDPVDWERTRRDMLARFSEKIGLYCLSRLKDSILMWSHYAQDHKGYCLEFEATDFTPVLGRAQEVRYAVGLPVVDVFNTPSEEQVDGIFTTKFVGWSYEEEWRIIDHERGPGLREYPAALLKSVIFGLRMPAADRGGFAPGLRGVGIPLGCSRRSSMIGSSRSKCARLMPNLTIERIAPKRANARFSAPAHRGC